MLRTAALVLVLVATAVAQERGPTPSTPEQIRAAIDKLGDLDYPTRTAAGPPEAPLQAYANNPTPRIERGISLASDVLAQLASEAKAAGARTGIILMPARFQIDDGDYGRLREIVAQSGGELVRDAATERFAAALGELALPTIDLLPVLRHAKGGPDLFFQENVHLTPRGHAVVGDSLAAFVQARFGAR